MVTGEVIAGKFRVERVLGEGGMGFVVAARHLQLGQMVALKFMRAEICTPEYRSRFLREARAISSVSHSNIATVYDYGETEDEKPFLVMELVHC